MIRWRGHSTFSSSWAEGNPGAVIDFFYTGIQKSVRGAKAVLEKFYGQPAKFNYFFGCSDGGREGLEELQRFPTEFDGAIIGAPVVKNVEHNVFWHGWNHSVNIVQDRNAIVTSDKIPALHNVLKGDHEPLKYPAQIVPQEGTDMFLDEAAAKAL